MSTCKRTLIISVTEIAVILALHRLLIGYFAGGKMASVMLSAGEHVPRTTLFMVGLFLFVRILTVCLPGMILARLGLAVMDAFGPNQKHNKSERLP
jgi:hypothetical protein